MNACQYLAAFLTVLFISLIIVLVKPAELPRNNTQRWIRSLIEGFFVTASGYLVLVFFGFSPNSLECWAYFNPIKLAGLGCLLLPLMIMATIGTYLSYGQLKWLLSAKEKIKFNLKKGTKK
jgi:hypothetical protein